MAKNIYNNFFFIVKKKIILKFISYIYKKLYIINFALY